MGDWMLYHGTVRIVGALLAAPFSASGTTLGRAIGWVEERNPARSMQLHEAAALQRISLAAGWVEERNPA